MKPLNLKTKILLDSASATDTDIVLHELGFLDGQTTNPTLLAKHNDLKYLWPLSQEALWDFYKSEALRIKKLIPNGEISVELYADEKSTDSDLIEQAINISKWFDGCYVKLPITKTSLVAVEKLVTMNVNLNLTLCFSQEQALAVHLASIGAKKDQVVISPFVGRLDDVGLNGVDLVRNILKMYQRIGSNVRVLSASIRTATQLDEILKINSNLLTAPRSLLEQWASNNYKFEVTKNDVDLKEINYNADLLNTTNWRQLNYEHELTNAGLSRFVADWQALIK